MPFGAWHWVLWSALLVAEVAALVTALRLARAHRPLVLLLAFVIAQEVAVRLLQALVLEPAPKPLSAAWLAGTLTVAQRAAYHVETALVAAWPAGVAVCVWWVFSGARSRRIALSTIAAAWLAFAASMAAAFPLPRGLTSPALHAFHVASVAVAVLAIMLGWSRRREPPAVAVGLLVVVEGTLTIVGPWARGSVYDNWRTVANAVYLFDFLVLTVAQLWLRRPGRE